MSANTGSTIASISVTSITLAMPWVCRCGAVLAASEAHGKDQGCSNPQVDFKSHFAHQSEFIEEIQDHLALQAAGSITDSEFIQWVAQNLPKSLR